MSEQLNEAIARQQQRTDAGLALLSDDLQVVLQGTPVLSPRPRFGPVRY
ncbi:hypothetical protein [Pseudomonas putida]|uniref:Uncharacterized protein n=1 Tax=Pseudomonas putida TaxID=303 RepID=A0AAW4BT05_PSEPU|nr:hypothetical protein [Pseudomonas putida]MBF8702511.1 hypothetical protein [Pseudomonas putida]MBF8735350.1 hypothetical protein [Pseudomonas putida]